MPVDRSRLRPTPGMPVPIYPTPLIEDTIEIEYVDSVAGVYNPIPFGTKYNAVEHGMNSRNLPNHVLVADTAADTTGVMRKRTWVSNRTDQDKYNFAIAYENSESSFPNYTRVYVLPREGYTPKELLTQDSFDPYAFLVAEQMISETDPPELRNQYVKVVRMYNTLPGPISYALEYPYGGNISYPRITTKQKFSHMEFPQSSGTKCPLVNYTDAILIGQTIQQTEIWAIDLVTRIYDVVPDVTYGEPPGNGDDYGGQEGYGYSIGHTFGLQKYPFLTWKFSVGKDQYMPIVDLSPCPIAGYETLRLVNQEASSDDKQSEVLRVERRYETLPGPVIHKVDFDNNEPAYPIITTTQRIAVNEHVAGTIGLDHCPVAGYTQTILVEQHVAPTEFGSVREDQRIYEINPSNVVISYDYDSAIDQFIETTRQKQIFTHVPPATDELTLELRQKPIDKYRTVQIQSRLVELPPKRVEFRTVNNWPFPTLLTGITILKTGLIANRNEVVWFPNTLRPIQNVPAILRVTTTYSTAPPPTETIFVLPTRNVVYRGISFTVSINNVLCDQIVLSVSFTNDTKYGNLTESFTASATNPSATQYYAVIGQYRVVACDVSLWRSRIWVKNISEVILV